MAITIYDVAEKLNLSASTVSKVLNGRTNSRISSETWHLVINTAREMDYRPNASARSLRTSRTHNIGLLASWSPELTEPHFGRLLEAIFPRARALGYRIVISDQLDSIARNGVVDGMIVLAHREQLYHDLVFGKKPHVFVTHASYPRDNSISWNDEHASYQAGQYLARLGHRNVAGIYGDIEPQDRGHFPKFDGFSAAFQEIGITPRSVFGELSEDRIENGYLLAKQLLHEDDGITAIFARNDFIAVGALRAATEAGKDVPSDISIIGYNDTIVARTTSPQLTSVHTPIADAGVMALERLVEAIESGICEFPGKMLEATVVARGSSGIALKAQVA